MVEYIVKKVIEKNGFTSAKINYLDSKGVSNSASFSIDSKRFNENWLANKIKEKLVNPKVVKPKQEEVGIESELLNKKLDLNKMKFVGAE